MAIYRKIDTNLWQDDFILNLQPKEKLFWIWVLTNPKVNQSGCYEVSKKVITFETGFSWEEVENFINTLKNHKKIDFDEENNEILIKNWLKYNGSDSPKVLKNIEENIEKIKNSKFKQYCIDTLSILYSNSSDTETQETETETKEETETKTKTKTKNKVFVAFASDCENLLVAFADFEAMRKKLHKPLTERASELICKSLTEFAPNNTAKQILILEQSVKKSWQDVYPLREFAKDKKESFQGRYEKIAEQLNEIRD